MALTICRWEALPAKHAFVLKNRQGLHCRPAAQLVKSLRDFDCKVIVEGNGATANARSIIGLLTLAAGYGTKLTFTVTGPDTRAAMAAIQLLFENDFAEAYREKSTTPFSPKEGIKS